MAIHYRGVWGAPGQFSLINTIEDARAALTWLREPDRESLVDTSRIVVLGHSGPTPSRLTFDTDHSYMITG